MIFISKLSQRRTSWLLGTALAAVVWIGMPSGLVWSQTGDDAPVAVQPESESTESPAAVSPFDASVAPLADEGPIPTKNLWNIIISGGVLMVPIGICSIILVMFVLERLISLRRGRVIPKPFVKRFLRQLREGEIDRDEAMQLCEKNGSPVAQVFAGAVRKWGRPAVEIEQAIIDNGERVTNTLRRYLRVINGVATVTPLLGLLGTVVGMIRAFNNIAVTDALGRPALLAKGISEALLTTAAGLSVAIPALICYLWFVGRVDRLIVDIDAMGQDVVDMISAEELEDNKDGTQNSRRKNRREAAA